MSDVTFWGFVLEVLKLGRRLWVPVGAVLLLVPDQLHILHYTADTRELACARPGGEATAEDENFRNGGRFR